MKKTLFYSLLTLLCSLTFTVSAQKGSLYLHMAQSGTITTYNLADISKVHFSGNTMDIVTATTTDSYAYSPLNTGMVSSDPDPQLDYTNGFGTDGSYEAPSQDASGYYLIDNGGKLFWLAEQVNNGTGAAYNAKLTADIDLEGRAWTPMGSAANTHGGELDGQGHSITGLSVNTNAQYTAFIGYHNGTTSIHDFSLDGSVTYTGNTADHCVAGVIAFNAGVNTVEDIICSVNIETPNATANVRIAGIVAREDNAGTINRCTYSGTNNGYATAMQVAGIVGMAGSSGNNMKVTNCLFTGTLKSTNTGAYVGGIAGYIGKSGTSFKNCLSAGSYDVPSGATRTGALIGAGNGNVNATTFDNCYILTGQSEKGSNSGISATISYTAVTDAQLANGSITTALGDNWIQGAATPLPHDPNEQPATHTHSYTNGFCTDATCTRTARATTSSTTAASSSGSPSRSTTPLAPTMTPSSPPTSTSRTAPGLRWAMTPTSTTASSTAKASASLASTYRLMHQSLAQPSSATTVAQRMSTASESLAPSPPAARPRTTTQQAWLLIPLVFTTYRTSGAPSM